MAILQITSLEEVYNELKKREIQPKTKYHFVHKKKTKNKIIEMSLGRIWFNLILPDDYTKLIDQPVDSKVLKNIEMEILQQYTAEEAAAVLSNMAKEAYTMTSIFPATFKAEVLDIPDDIREKKNKELTKDTKPEDFLPKLLELTHEYLNTKVSGSGMDMIAKAGVGRSKPVDFGVLVLAKGPTINIEEQVGEPITSALLDGYTIKEYYDGAGESRRANYIRAISTAEPGTLARHVTYANSNSQLTTEDCGTKKYLELFIRESMIDGILGRFYYDDRSGKLIEITKDNASKIINKTINLRSPLYCKQKDGICKICYGKLSERVNAKYIGLMAGAVINQAGIEGYSMSARHKTVQVNLKPVDFTKDIIII